MLTLQPVPKKTGLTRATFAEQHLNPMLPVVLTDFTKNWAGREKWTIEFFKKHYGHLEVPVASPNYSKPGKGYMTPDTSMSFGEYLTLLDRGPMEYRIFLWNLFKHAPELVKDFNYPNIMDGFIQDFPFMFFGGQGSITAMHYDIDMSHVFLNQLHGRKRVVLFSHEQSAYLYHLPYSVASNVDVNKPDYVRFPALAKAKGWETILYPGETIFIPSGYWHYIEYIDGGYSIALRSNPSLITRAQGAINIAKHYVVDKGMNKIMGKRWHQLKQKMAFRRAEAVL